MKRDLGIGKDDKIILLLKGKEKDIVKEENKIDRKINSIMQNFQNLWSDENGHFDIAVIKKSLNNYQLRIKEATDLLGISSVALMVVIQHLKDAGFNVYWIEPKAKAISISFSYPAKGGKQ